MPKILIIYFVSVLVTGLIFGGATLRAGTKRRPLIILLVAVLCVHLALFLLRASNWIISDITVMLTAMLAGSLIGSSLNSRSDIIAFCVAAALADVVSFSGGLTSKIIAEYGQGQSQLLAYLSITVPLDGGITPIIGIGDAIILSGIFTALRRMGHIGIGAFLYPLIGLLAALTVGLVVGGIFALPFIGAATILYLWISYRT